MTTDLEMSSEEFNDKYRGKPVWDTGRPQKAFVDSFAHELPPSPVLGIGCGSGDLALYVASLGCDVQGVDFSPVAIEQAKAKARAVGSRAAFEVQDIFTWPAPDKQFKTILDGSEFLPSWPGDAGHVCVFENECHLTRVQATLLRCALQRA